MAPSEDQQRSLEEEVREEKVMRWTSCDGGVKEVREVVVVVVEVMNLQ